MALIKLNVRCCCVPVKIMGTLQIPEEFVIRDSFTIQQSYIEFKGVAYEAGDTFDRVESHEIKIKDFHNEDGSVERAIYSDDRPLEFWKQFKTFIEGENV